LDNRILSRFLLDCSAATSNIVNRKAVSVIHRARRELAKETVISNMGQEVAFHGGGRGQSSSGQNGNNRAGKGNRDGKPKSNTGRSKTPEMKFVPHGIGKDRQTLTYQTVKDYIIQLVQKSFRNGKDVADSLRKMEKINMTKNMPARKTSKETGTDKAPEQEGFEMLYNTKQKLTSIPRGNMSLRTI
jgi:hypothetical protein